MRHRCEDQDHRGQRQVDEEHPGPARVLGEDTTEEDTGGTAGRCGGAVQGERLGQLLRSGPEDREEQGQCGGGDERGPGALHCSADQLDGHGVRQPGGEGTDGQGGPADAEDAAGAEQVGQPTAQQEQAAEGDDVRVEHPAQVLGAEAEVGLHLRQGDPDDRRVHDDHELRCGDQTQRQPAPAARGPRRGWGGRHGCLSCSGTAEGLAVPRRLAGASVRALSPLCRRRW